MDLTQAMRTAAAVRRFLPDDVSDGVLHRVLDSARFAPSWGNRQGWHVIVVRDQALRTQLKALYLHTWRLLYQDQPAQSPPSAAVERNYYAEHLDELPVHLVVAAERESLQTPLPAINDATLAGGSSIYPFVQNLVLAIRAEGLGTSLTMQLNNEEAEVRRLLEIPDGFALAAHLGVGWPSRPHPTRLQRRQVEEFTTIDRFGGEPLRIADAAPMAGGRPAPGGRHAPPAVRAHPTPPERNPR
jgi:nitroreductase